MEIITIKVGDGMAKEIKKAMKPNYSTKTEFIRDAIRDKIKNISKEEALQNLQRFFGKAKTKTTDEELERIREKVGKEYMKKFGLK